MNEVNSNLPKNLNSDREDFHNKKYCELCETGFGLKEKRHHCRKCNKSVC